MTCRAFRRALDRRGPAAARAARGASHLRSCPRCAALVARLEAARAALARPAPELVPPPGFAARVVAHLPRRDDALGWAALRLLPVSLALALVVGYFVATSPAPLDLPPAAGSDAELLAWLLLAGGGSP